MYYVVSMKVLIMGHVLQSDQFSSSAGMDGHSNKFSSALRELEVSNHLVRATIMACDSIEDLDNRNAMVALLSEIEAKIDRSYTVVKSLAVET